MDRIIFSEPLYQQIVQHVTQAIPMEAVGIIGGLSDGEARLVIELPNLAGPHEFFADPFAQFQAERRLYSEGLIVIAIYHSHPEGGTTLSDADQAAARRWNCAHIVIVPKKSIEEVESLCAWLVIENEPEEIPIIYKRPIPYIEL